MLAVAKETPLAEIRRRFMPYPFRIEKAVSPPEMGNIRFGDMLHFFRRGVNRDAGGCRSNMKKSPL